MSHPEWSVAPSRERFGRVRGRGPIDMIAGAGVDEPHNGNDGCTLRGEVTALVLSGSDYKIAYAPGAQVSLMLEGDSDRVMVVRGAIKLGYLDDPIEPRVAADLRRGCIYNGVISSATHTPQGTKLRVSLQH